MGINTVLKIGEKALKIGKKAYSKPLCKVYPSEISDFTTVSASEGLCELKKVIKPFRKLSYKEQEAAEELFRSRLFKDGYSRDVIGLIEIPSDKYSNVLMLDEFYTYLKETLNLPKEKIQEILMSNCTCNYLEFFNKELSYMTVVEKRHLAQKLISAKSYNDIKCLEGKAMFPAIPKNEDEYTKLIHELSSDIKISLENLPIENSEQFFNNLKSLISNLTKNKGKNILTNEECFNVSKIITNIYSNMGRKRPSVLNVKLLENIVNDAEFKKLCEEDKIIVSLASLLTKRTKSADDIYEMAYEAANVAKCLNLSTNSIERIFNIVKNSDAPSIFMEYSKIAPYDKTREIVLNKIAYELKDFNNFELTKLLYKQKYTTGFTRNFDKLIASRLGNIRYSMALPQTSLETITSKSVLTTFIRDGKEYKIPVTKASQINGLCGYLHTPDAGMTSGRRAFKPNTVNFEYFQNRMSDEIICANYIGSGKYYPTGYHGYFLLVSPNKQILACDTDIWSVSRNIDNLMEDYFLPLRVNILVEQRRLP